MCVNRFIWLGAQWHEHVPLLACVNWKKNLLYSTVPLSLIVYVWHKSHSLPSYSLHELYPPTWIKKTRFFSFFRSWPKISLMWLKLDSFGTTFSFFSFFSFTSCLPLLLFSCSNCKSSETCDIWNRRQGAYTKLDNTRKPHENQNK